MTRVFIRIAIGLVVVLALAAAVVRRPATSVDLDALARDVDLENDHVTAAQLGEWMHDRRPGLRIIDLRSDSEYTEGHIPGAEHMSLVQLRHAGFRPNETVVLYSAGGGHAAQGWFFLRASGLQHVYSLRGGADEWQASREAGRGTKRPWRGQC
jgi:3-mercaptopyruvate sulfurtransferase SseA